MKLFKGLKSHLQIGRNMLLWSGADIKFLVKRLRKLLADITFLEAYERTNRFLNVTVTAADTNEPPRMLNYMTAPNVLVWSAVACSSAFPGLFPAQELLARDRDGRFVKYATLSCTEIPYKAPSPALILEDAGLFILPRAWSRSEPSLSCCQSCVLQTVLEAVP
jgi:predicted acylesterase/phospholipase RssA